MPPPPTAALALATSAAVVAARRLRRGPARPTWSYGFETVVELLRRTLRDLSARDYPTQRREWDRRAMPSPVLRDVAFERVDDAAAGVVGAWCAPRSAPAPAATVLYLHGGSYLYGSVTTHREVIARLALAARARVFALTYRLAPEHPFPAPVDDAVRAYRWLLAGGVAPGGLVVAGDSAGGGLSVATLLALRDDAAARTPLPAGAALLSPWVDLTARGGSLASHAAFDWGEERMFHAWARDYLAGADPRDPRASPAFADLGGLPPLLVQLGSAEMLFDQVTAFVARARAHGADVDLRVWEDMVHNWHALAGMFPVGQRAIEEVAAFVTRVAGAGAGR